MTTSFPGDVHPEPAAAAVPPPGCPAHVPGGDDVARLYGPEAQFDSKGFFEKLRKQHGAVAPVLVAGDVPAWLVLGHRENMDVTRAPARFSRDGRIWNQMRNGGVKPDNPLMPLIAWQPMCAMMDGDEHMRLRKAVTDSMGRLDRRGIRGFVTLFTNQLADAFCTEGRVELVSQFCDHLPMMIMTQLIGMPKDYGPRLVEAARDMIKGTETAIASNEYVVERLQALVTRARQKPDADFASWLVEHEAGLTDEEAVQHLRLVLVAAYETIANLLANTLKMVFTDPRFRASLAGGHMTVPEAVEQTLWDEPPFMAVYGRWATQDTELAGQRIKAGDLLVLGLAAGNADPAVRPDLSVPVHNNRAHLAFSGGPHECPGQDIGRVIADSGVDALLIRLPDLHIAVPEDQLRWDASVVSRHLVALPAEFTAGAPQPPEEPMPLIVPRQRAVELSDDAPDEQPLGVTSWWSSMTRWFRGR